MNKIYSCELKVSLLFFSLLLPYDCFAHQRLARSLVSYEIPYQTYHEFATNRGPFYPGARDIHIYNKYGYPAGILNKAPMPDFSSVDDRSGISTIIYPQYAVSVHHNPATHFANLSFGNENYHMVNRGNIPGNDFSIIRLNKVVTEVIPANIAPADMKPETFADVDRFTAFYRMGSGTQKVADIWGRGIDIQSAYRFLTGGTMGHPEWDPIGLLVMSSGDVFNPKSGPLNSHGTPGDSGSPLFAWDAHLNKWMVAGTLSLIYLDKPEKSAYTIIPNDFVDETIRKYRSALITNTNNNVLFLWRYSNSTGAGHLYEGRNIYAMQGQQKEEAHNGRDLIFNGAGGVILLQDNVNQGSGTLTFNNNYVVAPLLAQTWSGGGVDVGSGATVTWKVNGVKNDNLHKIGKGTLKVNGTGVNPGGLKVGDGTVHLSQVPDNLGKVQAFSSVNLASGRPLVVLHGRGQVDPDSISWGFRGGRLDVNGNSLTFHRLNAQDYGAALINRAKKRADITLSYQRKPEDVVINQWSYSRLGQIGELYGYQNNDAGTTDYFFLKTSPYLWFPRNHRSNNDWEFIGHDRGHAIRTWYERHKAAVYIFHGQLRGNLNFQNHVDAGTTGALMLDGSVDISGNFSQKNGRLVFQGHPVLHAYNLPETIEKLRRLGDNSLRTEPVSFYQTDWQKRVFKLNNLMLDKAHFDLARNASLYGNINAKNSVITLGSPTLYIDINDGNGIATEPRQGISIASRQDDLSRYQGRVTLSGRSELNIREVFTGIITGRNSRVSVSSRHAILNGYSQFNSTPLTLEPNAQLTAKAGWFSSATVTVGPSATLSLTGTPVGTSQVIPTMYAMKDGTTYALQEGSSVRVLPFALMQGDIYSQNRAVVRFNIDDDRHLANNLSPEHKKMATTLAGFENAWRGAISAPHTQLSLKSTRWEMREDSEVGNLNASQSLVVVSGSKFRTLKAMDLRTDNTGFVLRTNLKESDKIVVRDRASGQRNTLFLNVLKNPGSQKFNIPLILAPRNTNASLFTVSGPATGFSQLQPVVQVVRAADRTQWILQGFKYMPNPAAMASAKMFSSVGYKNLIGEVNNLNKRMEDLRDTKGQDGAWGHTFSGSGAGMGGYADRYTSVQTGFDKKQRLSGANLFTGVLMSHTNSQASGRDLRGNTRSFGGGIYASALMDSGAYIDAIGKYIHAFDNYQAGLIGLRARDYTTRSWIGGVQSGYRYHLADDLYVEPQVGVVFSTLSATRLKWHDKGINVSMRHQNTTPLIGRTGVTTGKSFSGRNWALTARAGVGYQFDLLTNGETVLHDISGEKRLAGQRDKRMLYHATVDGQMRENLRFGLEMERSVFGNYNVNHAINAKVSYMF
ncbi:S6 family peptidase [Kosakonia sp. H02]|nr:S6 family peptidase [Kosakonia sp. H02]